MNPVLDVLQSISMDRQRRQQMDFQRARALEDEAIRRENTDLHRQQFELSAIPHIMGMSRQVREDGTVGGPGTGPAEQILSLQDLQGGANPLAGLPGYSRKADPSRRIQFRTQMGGTMDRELLDPREMDSQAIARKVGEMLAIQQATGIPVETPGGTRYVDPEKYYHYAQGRMTDAQREQMLAEPVMTVGDVRANPDSLRFRPGQMGSTAAIVNALGLFKNAKYDRVIDGVTGDARYTGVDPNTGQPITVESPDWKGIGKRPPRQAGGGSGEMKPDRVLTLENQAETLHGQRQQLGDQLAVQDGGEYAPGKPMTPGTRKVLEAKYRTATNKLRIIEKRLGREQTEAQPEQQAAPVVAQPQATAEAPAAPAAAGLIEGQTATNKATGQRLIVKGGQWVPLQ